MLGDENSAFFHGVINGRKAKNSIPGLLVNGEWVSKPSRVKKEVFSYFRNQFYSKVGSRPKLHCDSFKRLPKEYFDALTDPFTKEEIKDAVFDCGSDKAPGPDGFNFYFLKHFWAFFEEDFFELMRSFYEHGTISSGCSTAFITLIPKIKSPLGLKDYRPITLVGIISKVISKILANRMKKVMGLVISDTQSAFLKGRFILDGPLMMNEIITWLKKKYKKAYLLKIDFEKAYDNVDWAFLISVLKQMGFPNRWCLWIEGILHSARSSVSVNGAPTFDFQCQKGLRQGDPISPFLFLVVMEAFTCIINKAIEIGEIEGVKLQDNGPIISHLLYADDALLVGSWSKTNVEKTARLLRVFHICSGLKINLHKSNIYGIGIEDEDLRDIASVLGCRKGCLPFEYLGIKFGANMNRISQWKPVVDKCKNRLSSWKAKTLSIGGRLILIKSVLASLPIYYFSIYKAPVKVIESLEGIMKRFFWVGYEEVRKIHWVSWDVVSTPKKEGGLGVSKLKDVNVALLAKWAWRYKNEIRSLWHKVVEVCHRRKGYWGLLPANNSFPGCWKAIASFLNVLSIRDRKLTLYFKGVVGDGENIRFWLDFWCGTELLKDKWPNLFSLSAQKHCSLKEVSESFRNNHLIWSRLLQSDMELQQLMELTGLLNVVCFNNNDDRWKWEGTVDGNFSVADCKKLLIKERGFHRQFYMKRISWIPLKVKIFIWRAEMERIPTRTALNRRNVSVPDLRCVLCDVDAETAEHLFTGCGFSFGVWSVIGRWCKIDPVFAFHVSDLLQLAKDLSGGSWVKKVITGIVMITMWMIWKVRNEKVFRGKEPKVLDVTTTIKSFSFLWLKSRSRFKDIVWNDWVVYPLYMM
ncbi:putative RNA-directed DNA polymerase [Helianthus debilis subsp. tardiflorus]